MERLQVVSYSPEQTEALGARVGALLTAGSFVALQGGLGGGKTCFTRGVVAAIAPERAALVASPTYAIMNCYPGQPTVYHFDFYRLSGDDEIVELGFEDYFYGRGICIAEWSERLNELLPPDHLTVTFAYDGDDRRTIAISASGPASKLILQHVSKAQSD